MLCYDGWFPQVPRHLAWMGAEVILQPSATGTSDREQEIVIARANAIVRVRLHGSVGLNRLWAQIEAEGPVLELPLYRGRFAGRSPTRP